MENVKGTDMSQSNDEPKEFSGYIHKKEGLEFDVSEIEELAKDMAVSQLWPWDKISEDMRINFRMYASNMFKKGYRKTSQMHPDTVDWNNGGKLAGEFLNKNNGLVPLDEPKLIALVLYVLLNYKGLNPLTNKEQVEVSFLIGKEILAKFGQQKAVEYVPISQESVRNTLIDSGLKPHIAGALSSILCVKFASVKDKSNA